MPLKHFNSAWQPLPTVSAWACQWMVYGLIFVSLSALVEAGTVPSQIQPDNTQAQALNWDNVEARPVWISGVKPLFEPQIGLHTVQLTAGDEVTIRLPAYESIRLYSPNAPLSTDNLEVLLSNGSGLAVATSPIPANDGQSLWVAPDSPKILLAHIRNPVTESSPLNIALFVSRQTEVKAIVPHRNILPLDSTAVSIKQPDWLTAQDYWQLPLRQPVTWNIQGPVRLNLLSRLIYDDFESRLLQEQRIEIRLNQQPHRWLEFATRVETAYPVVVNGQQQTLGQLQSNAIAIPDGRHEVTIISDQPTLIQLARLDQADYLLPGFNAPKPETHQAGDHIGNTRSASIWSLSESQIRQKAADLHNIALSERVAMTKRLLRDNRYTDGGMLGYQYFSNAVVNQLENRDSRQQAEKLYGTRTFYRDLFPRLKYTENRQQFAWFIPHALEPYRPLAIKNQSVTLAAQHLKAWLSRLSHGYFISVPAKPDKAHLYTLPERSTVSRLRLTVDRQVLTPGQFFWLQIDQQPPLRIQLRNDISDDQLGFRTQTPAAALHLLHNRFQTPKPVTLSGAFSMFKQSAELIPVATFELALPEPGRTIRVWRAQSSGADIRLALQYRTSKPYKPSESDYLNLLDTLGQDTADDYFLQALHENHQPSGLIQTLLNNVWLPLIRKIQSHHRHYQASFMSYPLSDQTLQLPEEDLNKLEAMAQGMEKRGYSSSALRLWSRIAKARSGLKKQRALLTQATLLSTLGENFLAERLWRMLSCSSHAEIYRQAIAHLSQIYRDNNDAPAQLRLASSMLIQHPGQLTLAALAQALRANQDDQEALWIGLLLPTELQDPGGLVPAAYQHSWWHAFDTLLKQLPEPQQYFWQGLLAQRQGDYATAQKYWQQAGTNARDWSDALAQGLNIQAQFRRKHLNKQDKQAVVNAWQKWQQPGSKHWQEAAHLIDNYAGGETYYSIERNAYAKSFLGYPDKPVTLRLMGPSRLKLEVRPVHTHMDSELNDWVYLQDNGGLHLHPITLNAPVAGIKLIGHPEWVAGRAVKFEYEVPAGLHEIKLFMQKNAATFRVFQSQPELPLSVLPPLSPQTLLAAIPPESLGPAFHGPEHHWLVTPDKTKQQIKQSGVVKPELEAAWSILEQYQIYPKPATDVYEFVRKRNWEQVLDTPDLKNAQHASQWFTALVWLFENQPQFASRILFEAERIALNFRQHRDIQSLWRRISQHSRWQSVTQIQHSAGLQLIPLQGWQPESQLMQRRKNLIELKGDEYVLSDDKRLVIAFANHVESTLDIQLQPLVPLFLPQPPMTIEYQLDDAKPEHIVLQKDQPTQLTLKVPAGEHQLRLAPRMPLYKNQFLSLKVYDSVRKINLLEHSYQRVFYRTERNQPLQAYIEGPAWLRIDEWQQGYTQTRYQAVEAGWQLETILPASGQNEALVRLFQRQMPARIMNRKTVRTTPALDPVEQALIDLPDQPVIKSVDFIDELTLGGQEDGTYGIGAAWVRRNNVQEDRPADSPEQFMELRGLHHYFNEHLNLFSESLALARIRERGGPTFGIKQRLETQLFDNLFSLRMQGQLFMQVPDDELEISAMLKLGIAKNYWLTQKTSMQPSLSAFVRYLTLPNKPSPSDNEDFMSKVDQDIFTPYKTQHGNGHTFSTTLKHRPWLDTLWLLQGSIVSNQASDLFTPDHSGFELAWKQQMGSVTTHLGYRRKFYHQDRDRLQATERSQINLGLDWHTWFDTKQRIHFDFNYSFDIERSAHLGSLAISWYRNEGRGYRDIRPGGLGFKSLLAKQRPKHNNRIMTHVDNH